MHVLFIDLWNTWNSLVLHYCLNFPINEQKDYSIYTISIKSMTQMFALYYKLNQIMIRYPNQYSYSIVHQLNVFDRQI